MSGKKGSRVGPRKGAGRPKETKVVSEEVKKNYRKAAEELAEEYGEPIEKAGLRLVFKEDVQDSVKIAALKEYGQVLVGKESGKASSERVNEPETFSGPIILSKKEMAAYRILEPRMDELCQPGPNIILPEMLPDPAKRIASKKEPKKNKVIKLNKKK
jgi:hypothetical protein